MTNLDKKAVALYFFRKTVYTLYQEIGALQPVTHPELAQKARLNTAFFQREKERQSIELYHRIEHETDTGKILAPFVERTGLTLEEVYRAFAEGDWRNKFGGYNFGGPRWARIAELALELRQKIDQDDEEGMAFLVQEMKGVKTNRGFLISQFERTERRRR